MRWIAALQILELCQALIRFLGSRRIRVNAIRVRDLGLRQARVRARLRV